jgi:hypothetical protein
MELISHIYANATFSRDFYKQSRLKIASIKRIFRIFKQQHGLMNRAIRNRDSLAVADTLGGWWSQPGSNR